MVVLGMAPGAAKARALCARAMHGVCPLHACSGRHAELPPDVSC